MTEKEKVIEFIRTPALTNSKNIMGCSENWYNSYYAIKETFSLKEIESMSDKEVENLVKLGNNITKALY